MSKAVFIDQIGGSENLILRDHHPGKPGKGEVLLSQTAVGVNFIDIYYRNGLYPLDKFPAILGAEAVGYVEEIGEGVSPDIKIGDRYAYISLPTGAYAEKRIINADYLLGVPSEFSDAQIAATLMKGLTVHYLICRTFYVKPGDWLLVYAAAGGVGQILCQWASHLKAKIIGVVGSDEKMEIALKNGCSYVINSSRDQISNKVMEYTNGRGVSVAYDSIGKDTLLESIKSLGNYGLLVNYGQSSGVPDPLDLSLLTEKSLFVTRPSLYSYKQNKMELILSTNEVFSMISQKIIKIDKISQYKLSEVNIAQENLEQRKTTGSSVIII